MLQVDKLIPGGFGLATATDGKKFFLWNVLPGEQVAEYRITKNKSTYTEAIATGISEPSSHRVAPRDACFLSTSPWQIMDFAYENQQKQSLVVELFREHGIDIAPPPVFTNDQPYFYRNKMEYALYYDHATASIHPAFHQRGSHRKVPITHSSIERPELFARATEIIAELNHTHADARHYQSLLLRCNQAGEVSGGLYENRQPHPIFPPLTDTIMGTSYSYSPNGFFQINLPVYELALQEIKRHITTDQVLDLYSGVGTIGLSVARDKHLTLVECDKFAHQELLNNCRSTQKIHSAQHESLLVDNNSISNHSIENEPLQNDNTSNIKAVLSKSEEALDYLAPAQTVILDPPRAGCDAKLINKLLEVKPQKLIYLSCNPATQARDVKILLSKYRIIGMTTFNFFPRTPHIENLTVLSLF